MRRVAWLAFVLLAFAWLAPAVAADTVVYYHTDALRSVSVVTDAQGNVLERTRYAPYGQVLNRPLRDGPGYTGHQEDAATGLVYAQQRYYDPETGRFLSVDPVSVEPTAGTNFNRYWYAKDNPYRYTDPDGRIDWEMLGDSFRLEASVGATLGARVSLGPLKLSLALGSATYGAGITLAPDAYAFTEVEGPSGALEFGRYGVGLKGSNERSYVGRRGQIYSEVKTSRSVMFGLKKTELAIDERESNGELSGTIGVIGAKMTGSIDLGKAWHALRSSGKEQGSGSSGSGFRGVFRVEGRIDAARLDRRLAEH